MSPSKKFVDGDVLLVTKCWSEVAGRGHQIIETSKPAWVLIRVAAQGLKENHVWLNRDWPGFGVCGGDEYTIVRDPDEWPDFVCAAVAEYRLIGGDA